MNSDVLQVFSVPIVLVSLVDKDRQWFKSVMGLPGVTETDRQSSFCAWTMLPQSPECLVVSDARNDARFRDNKLVTGPPHIQFYAGCPLVSSNGMRLGSLCIIDTHTRYFTTEDCNLLCNLTEIAVREIEAQRADARLAFQEEPDEALRGHEAWDVGILCLHVGAYRPLVLGLRRSTGNAAPACACALRSAFWDHAFVSSTLSRESCLRSRACV